MALHSCSYLFSRTNTCVGLTRLLRKNIDAFTELFRQYSISSRYRRNIFKFEPFLGVRLENRISSNLFRRFSNEKTSKNPVQPHMIYFQNPLIWVLNRWDFLMLKWNWDPGFNLPDFRRGCKQALCTITQCIAEENYSELKGLISAQTLLKLKDEVNSAWNLQRRKDVALKPDQVHVVLPHKVYLQRVVENRFCDIDMILVAFKPRLPSPTAPHVGLLIEAAIRFHRNYTDGVLPDWTVTRLFLKSRDVHLEKSSTD